MESDSILESVKNYLDINLEDSDFDQELIININAVLSTLFQIGVNFNDQNYIIDKYDTWENIFIGNEDIIDLAKIYICLKVKTMFDPPSSSFVLEAMNKQISEFEWRIYIELEGGFNEDE